jgi:predicted nucleic acid-binding protein
VLVLDANILIRAVLGRRVRELLARYGKHVDLFVPDAALLECRQHLPPILAKRGVPIAPALEYLATLGEFIQIVELDTYASFEKVAQQRLAAGI